MWESHIRSYHSFVGLPVWPRMLPLKPTKKGEIYLQAHKEVEWHANKTLLFFFFFFSASLPFLFFSSNFQVMFYFIVTERNLRWYSGDVVGSMLAKTLVILASTSITLFHYTPHLLPKLNANSKINTKQTPLTTSL